jgi:uncharacterized repeat protein (TIGR02543 family)
MTKKLFLLITVVCLSIVLLSCSLNSIKVASASSPYILSDGFESGNLNAWTDYAGTLSINTQTVNSGNYSVESIVVGNNNNLYNQSLSSSPNPIDFREYVYINSPTVPSTSGDYYAVGGFAAIGRADFGDGEICVFNVNNVLYWGVYYRDVNVTTGTIPGFGFSISTNNSTSDATPVQSGAWTCVELKHTTGTSTSYGQEQLYVNGVSVLDVSVDNYDRTPAYAVIGGSDLVANNTNSWHFYLDDVVVSGSYIGPLQYQLTEITNAGTVAPGNNTYNEGLVTLSATAPAVTNPNVEKYIFQGWVGTGSGSYTGLNNLQTITLMGNVTETATWEHQYYLNVTSPYGTAIGSGFYDADSIQFAAVTPTLVGNAQNSSVPVGTQYVFSSWGGTVSGTSSTSNPIDMTGPETAIANWQTQYLLTVASAYGTTGGSGFYNSGANVSATVSPLTVGNAQNSSVPIGARYVFTSWSGNASGTTSPSNNITMTGPMNATANWQLQYNLTVAQSGVGSDYSSAFITVNGTAYNAAGFSTWTNSGAFYTFSYVPLLTQTPNAEQYVLTGISGNSTASSINVTAATTIIGAYQAQYYFTATSTYGSPSPASGWFNNGTSITDFVATPISVSSGTQYACSGWSGNGSVPASGSTSAVTFTINAPSSIAWNWVTQYEVSFATNPSGIGTTSPSGNVWENAGPNSIFFSTTTVGYTFSSWSSSTNSITFDNAGDASATATINGPGTITANLVSAPTPTPIVTPTPTKSPTPSPTPTSSASPKPTSSPSSTPAQSSTPINNNVTYGIIAVVIVVIVVGAIAAFFFMRAKKSNVKKP